MARFSCACSTALPLSSSGLGRRPLTAVTRVQIPLGVLIVFTSPLSSSLDNVVGLLESSTILACQCLRFSRADESHVKRLRGSPPLIPSMPSTFRRFRRPRLCPQALTTTAKASFGTQKEASAILHIRTTLKRLPKHCRQPSNCRCAGDFHRRLIVAGTRLTEFPAPPLTLAPQPHIAVV